MVLMSGVFYKHLTNDVDVVVGRPPCQGLTQNWIMMLSQFRRTIPFEGGNISFSSSYNDYMIEVEKYILTLRGPVANKVRRIEKSMRIFTEKIYGYLPTAGEMKWPVLEPNYNANVTRLVPFHEAYCYDITDAVIYFYIDDCLFLRIFTNPDKYLPFLKRCKAVIGPDVSQYTDMPAEMRYRHAWCNTTMSAYLQEGGVNLYPNITWSRSDSYSYSFPQNLHNSVIAINSNAVHKSDLSLYRWKSGYRMAIQSLSPLHIIRFGQLVDGEDTSISTYFSNERLNKLRNGRKRK